MSIIIENEYLKAVITRNGGEITSLVYKTKSLELIWEKDINVWKFQTPLLFPKVGSLNPNVYEVDGQTYAFKNHGFLRNQVLNVKSQSNNSVELSFKNNLTTYDIYPFEFEINVKYTLIKNELQMTVTINNDGENEMPIEFGYHPAFRVNDIDKCSVSFDKAVKRYAFYNREKLSTLDIDREDFITNEKLQCENTLIYGEISNAYTFKTSDYTLKFNVQHLPYLGIWSINDAFVCVEPWSNLPDLFKNTQNWCDRSDVTKIAKNSNYTYDINIKIEV